MNISGGTYQNLKSGQHQRNSIGNTESTQRRLQSKKKHLQGVSTADGHDVLRATPCRCEHSLPSSVVICDSSHLPITPLTSSWNFNLCFPFLCCSGPLKKLISLSLSFSSFSTFYNIFQKYVLCLHSTVRRVPNKHFFILSTGKYLLWCRGPLELKTRARFMWSDLRMNCSFCLRRETAQTYPLDFSCSVTLPPA